MEKCEHCCANCFYAQLEPENEDGEVVGICKCEGTGIYGEDWCNKWEEV